LSFFLVVSTVAACGTENGTGGKSTASNSSGADEGDDGEDDPKPPKKDGGVDAGKVDAGKGESTKVDAGKKDAGKTTGTKPGAGGTGGGGETCENKTVSARSTPPDMLIVLDKSLSMAATRWAPSTAAVKQLTSKYESLVSFGLEIFPAGFTCEPGILDVPMAVNNASKIATAIDNARPIGITPTAQSLRSALTFLGDRHAAGDTVAVPAFVVLVTDGEPNCPDGDTPDPTNNAIQACQALKAAEIPVYVIGYEIDALGQGTMNSMAQAGGTEKFFPVENQADLEAAFDKITRDVVRCEFELSEVPPDPSFVRVTIDGKTVVLDGADGWKIEGRKITLTGASCETLKDGTDHLLGAKVECEPIMVM
jgi:Mg-chelatase subunit ChlD